VGVRRDRCVATTDAGAAASGEAENNKTTLDVEAADKKESLP